MSDKSSMDLTAISDSKNGSHVGEKRSHDNLGEFFFIKLLKSKVRQCESLRILLPRCIYVKSIFVHKNIKNCHCNRASKK